MWKFALSSVVVAAMSLPATDNFNRGPDTLGANWSQNGTATWTISVTNDVSFSGASFAFVWWNADSFPDDQYSQLKTITSSYNGPACRVDTGGAITGYSFYTIDSGIYKWVAGSRSSIGSYSGSFSNGDTAKVVCTGSSTVTIEVFKNGVSLGSTTDSSSPIASGAAGMLGDGSGGGLDDWEGGAVGGGGGPTYPAAIINALIRCCR